MIYVFGSSCASPVFTIVWAASWHNQQNGKCAQRRLTSAWAVRPVRFLAVRMQKPWVLSYPLSAQRRLWSAWASSWSVFGGRTDHFVGFVMRRLISSSFPSLLKVCCVCRLWLLVFLYGIFCFLGICTRFNRYSDTGGEENMHFFRACAGSN